MRAYAEGLAHVEVAAELLIGHRRWLERDDFVAGFIDIGPGGLLGDTVMAVIDWAGAVAAVDAGLLLCSSSEGRVLRIAASLAGRLPVCVGAVLGGLDEDTIRLIAWAVLHANGGRGASRPVGGSERAE
jgi:hypothetical protein